MPDVIGVPKSASSGAGRLTSSSRDTSPSTSSATASAVNFRHHTLVEPHRRCNRLPDPYSTSIRIRQWVLGPNPAASFMACTRTRSWNPREANT